MWHSTIKSWTAKTVKRGFKYESRGREREREERRGTGYVREQSMAEWVSARARRFSISSLSAAIHQDFGAQTCFITARSKLLSYDSIPVHELACTILEQISFGTLSNADNASIVSYKIQLHVLLIIHVLDQSLYIVEKEYVSNMSYILHVDTFSCCNLSLYNGLIKMFLA